MTYKKLTEYTSKKIFDENFKIIEINRQTSIKYITEFIDKHSTVIVKVDEFVKRRGKQGLVMKCNNLNSVQSFMHKNIKYKHFILEKAFEILEEKYFCIRYENGKKQYIFNNGGGINCINPFDNATITDNLDNYQDNDIICKLDKMFDDLYSISLEVNPLILTDSGYLPIDFAIEIDSCGIHLWKPEYRKLYDESHKEEITHYDIETNIQTLDESSNSSLKFNIINQNGRITTLIAGGGASVLYTDAIVNAGYMDELYNYGEYSGNPTEDEVYNYCSYIFDDWFNVPKEDAILFIGGGISNFTDVAKTFKGIIRAIKNNFQKFLDNNVSIWVRRGGVGEKEGLYLLQTALETLKIKNHIYGSNIPITEIVSMALKIKTIPVINNQIINKQVITTKPNNIKLWNEYVFFIGNNSTVIQRIIDYDYYIGKDKTNILAIYDPFIKKNEMRKYFWGTHIIYIPITSNISKIQELIPKNSTVSVYNYASIRSCVQLTKKFADIPEIKTFYIIAEGLPESITINLSNYISSLGKTLLGPSSVGAIKAGINGSRIGSVGGLIDNIQRCNLSTNGYVAIVTKSGGLLNEMINYVVSLGLCVAEAVSIGGDRYHGVRFIDLINNYVNDDQITLIIMIGESGGIEEIEVTAIKTNKPIIAWCSGTSGEKFNKKIEFGHAGSSSLSEFETSTYKNNFMKNEGIIVPNTFEDIGTIIKTYKIQNFEIKKGRDVPIDLSEAIKNGTVRNTPNFISGITDERNDLKYRNEPIEQIIEKEYSIGYTIGLIWLNVKLDKWAAKFIEKIIVLMADHGPAVSGAQNTIITTRAGKNLTESIAAGILTIGPRFGGAISDSAKDFYDGFLKKESPTDFVERMKNDGKYIMGIGHRIKSKFNPDKRVEVIKKLVSSSFPKYDILNYAIEVEKITLLKKSNLILNVDGAIGASLIDLLLYYNVDILNNEILNGFFIIARSIGLIGHFQEQKMQKNGLYRVNEWDYDFLDI
jgi:ATP citrate (pro-S)-lyase